MTNDSSARSRQHALANALLERWDGLLRQFDGTPDWVLSLARQLDMWVGDELSGDNVYYEVTYDRPPVDARPEDTARTLEPTALNSPNLYIRAITSNSFLAVDVSKPVGEAEPTEISVFLRPRSHLMSLEVEDPPDDSAPQQSLVRLSLTYLGGENFLLPRRDDALGRWRPGDETDVFRELRRDLWTPAVEAGQAVFPFNTSTT